jgi:hypothetical protein
MTSLPFGAMPDDTAEFMLGRVAVTPVLLESNGAIDANVLNWTAQQKAEVLANVQTGLDWWTDLLAKKSPVHSLTWHIDTTYLDNPAPTAYEPINRISNDYTKWVPEFLENVGYDPGAGIDNNIRAFNDSQRQKLGTDWSFTIFVVNSGPDQGFPVGGSFTRAFAFAGGRYFVSPYSRPASTYTHETGHMFWARDEYPGGGNYYEYRGYYNSQNTNAVDLNPIPNFGSIQPNSIMSAGTSLQNAYDNVDSPDATLAQIGWVDSDNDGIFDVLDVPLELQGSGSLNAASGEYRFYGFATAKTLPNRNSSGLQNDITLNKVGRLEYRLNQSANWTTIHTYANPAHQVNVDLRIPIPNGTSGTIEIRAVDSQLGIVSNVFQGNLDGVDFTGMGGLSGFVWSDRSNDGTRQASEPGLEGWTVQLVNASGGLIDLQTEVEPDQLPNGPIPSNAYPGVTLRAIGNFTDGSLEVLTDNRASTGTKLFSPFSTLANDYVPDWRHDRQSLEARFSTNQASVSVDVIGFANGSYGRLEAYSSAGVLLERVTSTALTLNQAVNLKIERAEADIAYVLVKAHPNSTSVIGIDNLRFGAASETKTGNAGDYHFTGLLPGSYRVRAIPVTDYAATSPIAGVVETQVVVGQTTFDVDLGYYRPQSAWQNAAFAVDVSGDTLVTPQDVLQVINAIRRYGSINLDGSSVPFQPYVDVDGDRNLSPIDILVVINYLRRQSSGSGEGEGATPEIVTSTFEASSSISTTEITANVVRPISQPLPSTASPVKVELSSRTGISRSLASGANQAPAVTSLPKKLSTRERLSFASSLGMLRLGLMDES